ncbi:MAG: GNAT family N-acetyltransferase [Candidatus Nanopelagicales bacterium]
MATVTELDAADESEYAAFYSAYARSYDRRFDTRFGPNEKRIALRSHPWQLHLTAVAREGARVVGGAYLDLSTRDNLDRCFCDVWVAPAHRRRGHGTDLLEWGLDQARSHNRTLFSSWASWDLDGSGNTAQPFLEHHGFAADLPEEHRVLDLPPGCKLPSAPVAPGYNLITWRERCPEEHIDNYARLRGRLAVEAPSGEHGFEEEAFDAVRIRCEESEFGEANRSAQTAAVVAPDGTLAGHTQLVIPAEDPPNVYQWDTLVLPEHRGHGLGLALKVANMTAAGEMLAGRSLIHTWNAAGNAHMIGINEAMGFRLESYAMEMTRQLQ